MADTNTSVDAGSTDGEAIDPNLAKARGIAATVLDAQGASGIANVIRQGMGDSQAAVQAALMALQSS